MIKLQDFARQLGVTDRALQKHLKNYAAEFEGLYQRKGPNGTWLTDEACELLRSKMRQQPIVVGDAQAQDDLDAAKERIAELLEEKAALAARVAALSDWKAEKSMLLAEAGSTRQQLQAAQDRNNQLLLDVDALSAQNDALSAENAQLVQEAQKAARAAQEAQDGLTEAQEAAQKEKARLEGELEEERKRNQALEARTLWDYLKEWLFGKEV